MTEVLRCADPPPPVVSSQDRLQEAADALATGRGPVAVDAERAGSYRYSPRAYLVQLHRRDGAAVLIDPLPITDFSPLDDVLGEQWVMQAAHNDLECLAEIGLRPTTLFDTEIAAQLLGVEKVGLASLVEARLGMRMRKSHGQADWSKRPLRRSWLEYAVLDVYVLPDLHDLLLADLREAGKEQWARQEFAHQLRPRPATDPEERWRRTSGIGRLRSDAQRGALRALWHHRDTVARSRDIAWHRVVRDQVMVEMALTMPATAQQLADVAKLPRPLLNQAGTWLRVIAEGARRPEPRPERSDGPPPRSLRAWEQRDPDAARRWVALRERLGQRADELQVWRQTLLSADIVADLAWQPPPDPVARMLELGARPWQVDQTFDLFT